MAAPPPWKGVGPWWEGSRSPRSRSWMRHAHETHPPSSLRGGGEGGRRGHTCADATRIHNTGVNVASHRSKMARSARPRISPPIDRSIDVPSTISREVRFHEAIFYSSFLHSIVRSFLSYVYPSFIVLFLVT